MNYFEYQDFLIVNPVYHGVAFHSLPLNYDYNRKVFNRAEQLKEFDKDVEYFTDKTIQVYNSFKKPLANFRGYPCEIKKFYWVDNIDLINFDLYDKHPDLNYLNILITKFKEAGLEDKLFFLSNNIKKDAFKRVKHIPINTFIGVNKVLNQNNTLHRKKLLGFEKKFLFLSRKPKFHREELYNFLAEKDILKDCLYTHNSFFDKSKFIEGDDPSTPGYFTGIKVRDANKTFCNIVTETMFVKDEMYGENIFITEKIDRCFAQYTPFIVASTPHYLKYIKDLGFKTFDYWWDESYDSIEDDIERLDAIKSTIDSVSKWPLDKCRKVYYEMEGILKHNHRLFLKAKNYRKKKDFINNKLKGDYFNFCFFDDFRKFMRDE